MDEALEVEIVLDPEGHRQGAHPNPGHRRVGDVDEVDTGIAEEPGGLDRPLDPDAPRRVDLDRHDEAAGGEELGQTGRRRRVAGGCRVGRGLDDRRPRPTAGDLLRAVVDVRGRGTGASALGIGRVERVEGRPHLGDVIGRRAAAAADDPRAGRQHARRHRPEILGAGGVDEAPLEPLRQTGVRHDRPCGRAADRPAHRLEGVEAGRRPRTAVDPDRVGAGPGQRFGGRPRAAAVGEDELFAECQRGDDRHIRRPSSLLDGEQQLPEIRERLEDDDVGATLEQALDLLSECRAGGRLRDVRQAPCRRAERSHGTADERIAAAHLAGLAGELCRAPVELADATLQAPGRESLTIRPERQGLDQLGARLEILPMGSPDHLRMTRDELLEAGALGHAPAEQERAQPAVDEDRAGGETTPEALPRRAAG